MEKWVVSGGCSGVPRRTTESWSEAKPDNLIQTHNDIRKNTQITKYLAVKRDRSQQYVHSKTTVG